MQEQLAYPLSTCISTPKSTPLTLPFPFTPSRRLASKNRCDCRGASLIAPSGRGNLCLMRRGKRDEARQGETIAMPDPTYPQSNSPNTTSNSETQRDEEIARVYRERLDERNRALERWTTRDRMIADMRLAVFL